MKRIDWLKAVLWLVASLGAVAIVARLFGGLGAATDLSDAVPWGMWKILNMVAGVALATGGFALAATVYVFGLKKYRAAMKPAVVIAMLGYGASCFALFLDIGLPHAIWKPLVFWNPHSFLFEVAWCVMLYFTITILEAAPIVLERFKLTKWVHLLHQVSIPLVIVGITLSTLHHTSLGSLFLAMPARLHDLWFTNWLPVLFIFSAVGAGLQTVVLVLLGYGYFYRRKTDLNMVAGLAKASAVILTIYFVLKITDLALRGRLGLLYSGQWESGFFIAELLLGAVVPVALIAVPRIRNTKTGLTTAAVCAVSGLVLNRLNVGITGLLRTADVSYFPSAAEIALSLGVIAMAGLVLVYGAENFSIFEKTPAKDLPAAEPGAEAPNAALVGGGVGFLPGLPVNGARWSLLVVIGLALGVGAFSGDALQGIEMEHSPVAPPRALDAARTVLVIDGDRDGDAVPFKHEMHKHKLGNDKSCVKCHHLNVPGDKTSSCGYCHRDMRLPTSIFDHDRHVAELGDNRSCAECHEAGKVRGLENSKSCVDCHKEDMWPAGLGKKKIASEQAKFKFTAPSHVEAMHGLCLKCHRERDHKAHERRMGECAFCHAQGENPASAALKTGGERQRLRLRRRGEKTVKGMKRTKADARTKTD